jgi:ABC-type transport system involved in cytochrome bd biosynthesis fused ATPase/permease subunit
MSMRIKDRIIFLPLLPVGGSILVSIAFTILNSMVYIDPALVVAAMLIVILAVWSVLNRWEGERQLRRIQSESSKLGQDATEQERRNRE